MRLVVGDTRELARLRAVPIPPLLLPDDMAPRVRIGGIAAAPACQSSRTSCRFESALALWRRPLREACAGVRFRAATDPACYCLTTPDMLAVFQALGAASPASLRMPHKHLGRSARPHLAETHSPHADTRV
jgi:hypothetical protein